LILAPHEIHEQHLRQIQNQFPDSLLYSELKENSVSSVNKQVLIIDNVGMLSRLYYYATFAYIGGGFTKDGIHNCLEAAVYGKPVVFGTNYAKYREAKDLIEVGGAFSVASAEEFERVIQNLIINDKEYEEVCNNSRLFITNRRGATQKIMDYIQENLLLTN